MAIDMRRLTRCTQHPVTTTCWSESAPIELPDPRGFSHTVSRPEHG
jgi:hypothetical protein